MEHKIDEKLGKLISRIEKIDSYMENELDIYFKDVDRLKVINNEMNDKIGTLEFSIDKVVPVKTHSMVCNYL